MFDKEFYPTPRHVLDIMGIDCYGKTVLEPSAGKGDIVEYCKEWGALEVLAVEKNDDLRRIVSGKANVIGSDFFDIKAENIAHIDCIIGNPPFSNADKHILHAWSIAPEGCEITMLCNWQTIANTYGYGRNELKQLIEMYGEAINLGNCFTDAERKTGIEIGMVKLFKPKLSGTDDFDDFYLLGDEDRQDDAIISFNEIKAVVNTYTAAVRCFEKVEAVSSELHSYTNVEFIGRKKDDGSYEKHKLSFGEGIAFKGSFRDNDGYTTKAEFARAFQMKCWQFIFDRVGVERYVTKGVLTDINKFINNRKNYPFTVRNISKMLDIIIGTRADIMNRAIVEAVDNFTRYTHENRYGVEGWKTNSGYLLNRKFIVGYISELNYTKGLGIRYFGRNFEQILDLTKALCFVTGKPFDEIPHITNASTPKNTFIPNQWYDWGFFTFKVYKKGTGHFKFKDENDWAMLNRAYAKIKGQVLPEKL